MHILLVEDDLDLGPALLAALKAGGMSAQWVRRANDARAIMGPEVDLVLLDRTLANQDGLTLLREWRAHHCTTPVIFITTRGALPDRLEGLDEGADDYLVKPFDIPELLARLWAVHRRHRRQAGERRELGALARNPEVVVPKQILGQLLEPLGDPVDAATVEVHLSNLRRKIGGERIRTVRGVGSQPRP